jgi:signal transduction histidine kinase
MKLQTKILILLSIVLGIILVSFLSYQFIQLHEKELIFRDSQKSQEQIIDKVLQINRVKTEQLINDNSGWDDMVEFTANPDLAWAKDNVNFFVNQFKLSFVLIYNKEKKLVYQFGDSICLKGLTYPDQALINLKLTKAPFSHYFQSCGNQLIEMFGAIIVPSSDADPRTTPPQGYLFIGRKWDDLYLDEHAEATGYSVNVINDFNPKTFKKDHSKIYFFRALNDYSGNQIGTVVFSKTDELQGNLRQLFNLSILSILFSLIGLMIFLYYFRRIILIPINKLNKALYSKNTEGIQSLKNNDDEFKILANLTSDFFDQQETLKNNNAKLEEINATKDRLFSIIAHDLKNPVGSIVSISDLLSDYLQKNDFKTVEELVEMLKHQSNEALALLTSLLDWARSQSGQMVFSPEMQSLAPIANEVVENLRSSAQLKNITIQNQITEDLQCFADFNMLKTVLRNLVSNAIKYTNMGGSIGLSAERHSDKVEICIADNGVGMDEETRNKLFRIEAHLSARGTANEKGNGLGLIICKEIIEKHGGKIHIESKLNNGSRFIFTLPSNKPE